MTVGYDLRIFEIKKKYKSRAKTLSKILSTSMVIGGFFGSVGFLTTNLQAIPPSQSEEHRKLAREAEKKVHLGGYLLMFGGFGIAATSYFGKKVLYKELDKKYKKEIDRIGDI